MTHKPMKIDAQRRADRFPPEASVEYPEVVPEQIDALRRNLADRFGIGSGRLRTLCEPSTDQQPA